MAGKAKCPGNPGRVCWNHFSGNLHLSSFYWLAEFLCGEFSYQSIGKSGKRLFHAYLCSSLCGSAGLVQMLAKGYHQYGMMFVFAVTVVMVAVYANARACLKNHSRKL